MNSYLNNKAAVRLTVNDVVLFLFWLFYFTPPCIERISGTLGTLAELLSYGFFLLFLLLNFSDRLYINRFHIALLAFLVWCTFCVALSSTGSLFYFARGTLFPIIELLVVVDTSVRKNGFNGIRPLYYVCCIYLFLNFVSMVLFSGGMFTSSEGSSIARSQWILGSKNNIPIYVVIFITVIMAFEVIKKNTSPKKRNFTLLFIIMALYEVLFSGENGIGFFEGSSTGIMAIVACTAAFVYLTKLERLPRLFTMGNTIIGAAAANAFLLGGMTSSFVTKIITEVFNKSVSFSGRTTIWQVNLQQIPNSPIWGHGLNTFAAPVYVSGVLTTTSYTYNMFLKYMISYGVTAIILLAITLLCIRKASTTLIQLLNVGLIGIIIIGTMNEVSICDFMLFPIMMSALGREVQLSESAAERLPEHEETKPSAA